MLTVQPPENALVLKNRHTGEVLAMRRFMREGQPCLALWGTLPPRSQGPPLHIHHQELESGTVAAGTLSAIIDGKPITLGTGQSGAFPIGSAHRWWNGGDDLLIIEGEVSPAVDLDRYLQAVFDVLNSGPADRLPLFYMARVAWRHRRTQTVLFMPRALQTIVLPLIMAVGTLLGRYRGTDWPGSPTRCIEVPTVSSARSG